MGGTCGANRGYEKIIHAFGDGKFGKQILCKT
jgi:hypothetical protein